MLEEFNLLTLLMFLLTSGGKDLVSYIPADAYWSAKGVEMVTVDAMLPEVAPRGPSGVDMDKAIVALGSADPADREAAAKAILSAGPAAIAELEKEARSPDVEVARRVRTLIAQIRADAKPRDVRRLMAIRTLGDLRDARALPVLAALKGSTDPFVAEYAADALAKIGGAPAPPPRPRDAKGMAADLELLPASCAAVVQLQPRPGLAPPFEQAIADPARTEGSRSSTLRSLATELIAAADRYGNLRVDGLTVGVSGDFTGRNGFVVAVARGQYDPALAAVAAVQQRLPSTPVAGQQIFMWGPESHAFFPSPDRAVFFAAPDPQRSPAAEMVAAVAKGQGTLRNNADLAKLIDAADRSQPVWAVANLTPALRTMPGLDGLDVMRLSGEQQADAFELKLTATGTDAARVKASAADAQAMLKGSLPELDKLAGFMPPLAPARDFLKSIRLTPSGTDLAGSATWKGSVTNLYTFLMFPFTTPVEPPK